ncbi:hypothetical protein CL634_10710 [bacterium]|nr:hypothetical protein [bacterium]
MTPNDQPLNFDNFFEDLTKMTGITLETEAKYLYIPKNVRNRDQGFDVPIQNCTNSPDLDDMICHGTGDVTICEGDNGEMSWEWDDYIIVRTGD